VTLSCHLINCVVSSLHRAHCWNFFDALNVSNVLVVDKPLLCASKSWLFGSQFSGLVKFGSRGTWQSESAVKNRPVCYTAEMWSCRHNLRMSDSRMHFRTLLRNTKNKLSFLAPLSKYQLFMHKLMPCRHILIATILFHAPLLHQW